MTAAYFHEWIGLLVRWLHVIAAIAWIGSSFFFMHLDASLKKLPGLPANTVASWQVHGGGFYEMRKFSVAPEVMPAELTWHKWQSYWTWMSGFFLLVWIYYLESQIYLIDPAVMQLTPVMAAAIGLAALAGGWVIYDLLCKSPLSKNDAWLGIAGFAYVILASWVFSRVFSGRGALIHTGALMATIMTANVFMRIIPNTRRTTDAMIAGKVPDPAWGKEAKQRSAHNNYITLPVVFMMISNHYPVTFGNSAIIPVETALVIVTGALIRHFYNVRHADHSRSPWWAVAVSVVAIWTAFWFAMASSPGSREKLGLAPAEDNGNVRLAGLANPPEHVVNIVAGRCSMCHSPEPAWEGIGVAPKNVMLDTPERIARQKDAIRIQVVMSHAMPPMNASGITPEERHELAVWLASK